MSVSLGRLADSLRAVVECPIRESEAMSRYTSFGVGGPADIYAEPESERDLLALLRFADENRLPWLALGGGMNILVSDNGIRGLVIRLGKAFDYARLDGMTLIAGAAANLSSVAKMAVERGLGGLEGAATVPGSVGGGVIMNAGTNAGKVGDTLARVRLVSPEGIRDMLREEIEIGYRSTALQAGAQVITEAEFHLRPGRREDLMAEVERMRAHRLREHPNEGSTAGCTFKNPPDDHAGWMLERAGAKGMTVGGAVVSDKHANFVLNTGGATAADILELTRKMRELVEREFGVTLEYEIRIVGDW